MIIGLQFGQLLGTFSLALAFGVLYAMLTHWMRANGYLRGVTAYQVMWGVLITLTINLLVHHPDPTFDYILEIITFGCTGGPMIVEHQLTYFFENKRAQDEEERHVNEAIEREAAHG